VFRIGAATTSPRQETGDDMGSANDGLGSPTRRNLLVGASAAGVAVTLAGCGSSDSGSSGSNGAVTFKTSDVPVGGGAVNQDAKVVVTQPTAGQYKAFTAVCTHQGCIVSDVKNGLITCPCHGSQYSAADGSVKAGPASSPLASKPVSVSGDTITVT
jgi:Rieske Fe-S protein